MQDWPGSKPPVSDAIKMLEGGVEVILPAKLFHHTHSVEIYGLKPPNGINATSRYSTNAGSSSCT